MSKFKTPIEVLEEEKHRIIGRFYDENIKKGKLKKGAHKAPLERAAKKISNAIEVLKAFEDEI